MYRVASESIELSCTLFILFYDIDLIFCFTISTCKKYLETCKGISFSELADKDAKEILETSGYDGRSGE